jgi:hypothetical protein
MKRRSCSHYVQDNLELGEDNLAVEVDNLELGEDIPVVEVGTLVVEVDNLAVEGGNLAVEGDIQDILCLLKDSPVAVVVDSFAD